MKIAETNQIQYDNLGTCTKTNNFVCTSIRLATFKVVCFGLLYESNRSVVEWIERLLLKRYRLGFDSRSGQTKDYKNWYSQLSCLTFSIKRNSVKPPPCVVDRWAGGSLTRRPKGPFAVSWPRQLGE